MLDHRLLDEVAGFLTLPQRVKALGSHEASQSAGVGTIGIYTRDEPAGRRAFHPVDVRAH